MIHLFINQTVKKCNGHKTMNFKKLKYYQTHSINKSNLNTSVFLSSTKRNTNQ